jgi:16S rRNA (guanine527-N7)-methyltransferase
VSRKELLNTLQSGVEELGLSIPSDKQASMLAYLRLVEKWNRVYNLTAVRGIRKLLIRHLLDSLTVLPHLCGRRILDIGTGAGLPGIPLALAAPELQLVLLDSNAKRIRFLRQVVAELALDNVTLVQDRVEEYRSGEKFDTLVSRAYTSLAAMIESSGHLLSDDGCIIAMKGLWPGDETTTIPEGFHIDRVIDTHVPELNEQRHLVLCRREN